MSRNRSQRSFQPTVEHLEDRCVPAVILSVSKAVLPAFLSEAKVGVLVGAVTPASPARGDVVVVNGSIHRTVESLTGHNAPVLATSPGTRDMTPVHVVIAAPSSFRLPARNVNLIAPLSVVGTSSVDTDYVV